MEGEWRQYKDAFVGVAEELFGRTSGERRYTVKTRNHGWCTEEVDKADDIRHYRQKGATTHRLKAPVWPEEEEVSQEGGRQIREDY